MFPEWKIRIYICMVWSNLMQLCLGPPSSDNSMIKRNYAYLDILNVNSFPIFVARDKIRVDVHRWIVNMNFMFAFLIYLIGTTMYYTTCIHYGVNFMRILYRALNIIQTWFLFNFIELCLQESIHALHTPIAVCHAINLFYCAPPWYNN